MHSHKIIVISGPVSSGKTSLADYFTTGFDAHLIKTRDLLVKQGIRSNDRISLQKEGDKLDKKTNGKWVIGGLTDEVNKFKKPTIFVVDSVRIMEQVNHIRRAFGSGHVVHVHLKAPLDILENRYNLKYKGKKDVPPYATVRKNVTEMKIVELEKYADVVIDTTRCVKKDVFVRAASRISLYQKNSTGYVDVVVGGQYGSEGKGQIVAYIAKEYDLLVRVGGPNAGHTIFVDPDPYTHHQLPSGTLMSNAGLLLGPGMVINVDKLLKEISECEVEKDRLTIDPNAIIIDDNDIKQEEKLKADIGSTGQGVGHATARKIMKRNPSTKLAKDITELKPYIGNALDLLSKTMARNGRILLEGTQGTGLSIHHGEYPYVTSRDTTVAGCLSEAGIAPSSVRRIVMVCRTYPIRVESPKGATSGSFSKEISFKDIGERSGINPEDLEKHEITSTTKRKRRVGEFDWDLIRKAAFLNGPTDIALTFADYINIENRQANRFEQLTDDTINLIEEIEHVTRAKISLIATGFNSRSIIDRRDW